MSEIHNPKSRPEPEAKMAADALVVQGIQGQVKVMTFEPSPESLDTLIAGLKRSIEYGACDHNAGVTLLLAELLKQSLTRTAGEAWRTMIDAALSPTTPQKAE